MNNKREQLEAGQDVITSERGHSMEPLIKSGQKHRLSPTKWTDVEVNDIVYCKVGKYYYTHLVKDIKPTRGVLIGNNKGRINGWTIEVFGKVVEVY